MTTTSARQRLAGALATLTAGLLLSACSISPAEQQATRDAWAARDAERARECDQARGRFVAGGCIFGGQ